VLMIGAIKLGTEKTTMRWLKCCKRHKTVGRLRPKNNRLLRKLTDSTVLPKNILTSLQKRNG